MKNILDILTEVKPSPSEVAKKEAMAKKEHQEAVKEEVGFLEDKIKEIKENPESVRTEFDNYVSMDDFQYTLEKVVEDLTYGSKEILELVGVYSKTILNLKKLYKLSTKSITAGNVPEDKREFHKAVADWSLAEIDKVNKRISELLKQQEDIVETYKAFSGVK